MNRIHKLKEILEGIKEHKDTNNLSGICAYLGAPRLSDKEEYNEYLKIERLFCDYAEIVTGLPHVTYFSYWVFPLNEDGSYCVPNLRVKVRTMDHKEGEVNVTMRTFTLPVSEIPRWLTTTFPRRSKLPDDYITRETEVAWADTIELVHPETGKPARSYFEGKDSWSTKPQTMGESRFKLIDDILALIEKDLK